MKSERVYHLSSKRNPKENFFPPKGKWHDLNRNIALSTVKPGEGEGSWSLDAMNGQIGEKKKLSKPKEM